MPDTQTLCHPRRVLEGNNLLRALEGRNCLIAPELCVVAGRLLTGAATAASCAPATCPARRFSALLLGSRPAVSAVLSSPSQQFLAAHCLRISTQYLPATPAHAFHRLKVSLQNVLGAASEVSQQTRPCAAGRTKICNPRSVQRHSLARGVVALLRRNVSTNYRLDRPKLSEAVSC